MRISLLALAALALMSCAPNVTAPSFRAPQCNDCSTPWQPIPRDTLATPP